MPSLRNDSAIVAPCAHHRHAAVASPPLSHCWSAATPPVRCGANSGPGAPPLRRRSTALAPPWHHPSAAVMPALPRRYAATMLPRCRRRATATPLLRRRCVIIVIIIFFRQGRLQRYHSHDCQQHCRRRRCPHYIAVCRRYADSTPPLRRPSAAFLCRCYPPPQAANVVAMADDIAIVLIPLFPSSSLNVLRAPRLGHRCAAA